MSKKIIIIQIIFICLLAGLFVAYVRVVRTNLSRGATYIVAPISATSTMSGPVGDAPLINPVVTANLGKHFIINFKPLEDQFRGIKAGFPEKTYVYFAYLNNSAFIGIGEDTMFTAASTLKVPLAMAPPEMVTTPLV